MNPGLDGGGCKSCGKPAPPPTLIKLHFWKHGTLTFAVAVKVKKVAWRQTALVPRSGNSAKLFRKFGGEVFGGL